MFLCVEPVINCSPSPCSIWICLSPFSQPRVSSELHVLSHRMSIIVVWNLGFELSQNMLFIFFISNNFRHWGLVLLSSRYVPGIPLRCTLELGGSFGCFFGL